MNKKFGVLMTALLTVGSTAYADDDNFDSSAEDDLSTTQPTIESTANGVSIDYVYVNDEDPYVKEVLDFNTTGASMAEFRVTVNEGELSEEIVTWDDDPSDPDPKPCRGAVGGADGTTWSLKVCDTWRWGNKWVLTATTPIKSIKIEPIIDVDGDGEAAVFDVIYMPEETPGSKKGRKFSSVTGYAGNITATYSEPVRVLLPPLVASPSPSPQNDLYGVLKLEFNPAFTGTMTFRADADNVKLLPRGCYHST
jgi:hypothetical protein